MKNYYDLRNSKGQFVSRSYAENNPHKTYRYGNDERNKIFKDMNLRPPRVTYEELKYSHMENVRDIQQIEKELEKLYSQEKENSYKNELQERRLRGMDTYDNEPNDPEIIISGETSYQKAKWEHYGPRSDITYEKFAKQNDINYSFKPNINAEQVYGISPKQQDKFYDLFFKANRKGEEIYNATDGHINIYFSYNMNKPLERLEKMAEQARKVLNGDYVKKLSEVYLDDFIELTREKLSDKDYSDLMEKLKDVDSETFLRAIKKGGQSSLAYALESIENDLGYNEVMKNIRVVLQRVEQERG